MENVFDFVDKDTFTLLILDKCCEELGYLDGHGKEIRIYLDAGKNNVTEGDEEKNTESEGDKRKNTETEGDTGKNTENEGEPVHYNRDKGKSVVIEESGDGERADWIDWDRDDEDMRENEEWVADSEDDLYDGDESVDYNEDDEFFDENVDKEAEWAGILQDNFEEMRFDSDDHTDDDSPDEFDSQKNSDEDNVAKAPVFCPDDTFDPRFALGMKFSHKKEFRGAVHSHAIMTRRNLAITKNDKRRVYARCKSNGCSWHINALKIKDEMGFQIREYNHVHNCGASFNVKNVRINWLSQRYVEAFRSDPNRSVKGFRQDVIRQIRCNVSRGQAYKTKRRCLQEIQGDGAEQYSRMWDYAGALRNKNPGSTIIMNLEDADATGKKNLNGFYVCFAAVKKGFLSGCRPFICVDGCHLKGPHGVVMSENKDNWEWFLTLLKEDLNIVRDDAYTFISDKQKGLLPAFDKVLPGVENRFCVRHLHGNMKTAGFKGLGYKKALWFAAKTTTLYPRGKREAYSDNVGVDKGTLSAKYMHQQSCLLMVLKCGKKWLYSTRASEFWEEKGRPARARRLEPDEVRKGKKPGQEIQKMPRQRGKMRCKFCQQVGHNTKGCKWKKFADEFPVDDVFELAAETEQHETAPIQQDEVIVNEDCPPISQPEEVSAPEADVSKMKKPVKRAIFNDADVAPVAVQVFLYFAVNVVVNVSS
ncbi:UNVERIFIED_CONTAM: hypothetical protein Sangu_1752700 [Sesamum angustifolium]|uniref:Transposase MuDR plant domain-containing protein n=1 Tax=Sesamum angustifolium TaxID=2727405 RepID=A0AAW2M5G2_9LAMI